MTKLKINNDLSIRTFGNLYCLSDLYKFMRWPDPKVHPKEWGERDHPYVVIRKGLFFRSYWGKAACLEYYAKSLTPGIYKEVRIALGIPTAPRKPSPARALKVAPNLRKPERKASPMRSSTLVTWDDLFVVDEVTDPKAVMQNGSHFRKEMPLPEPILRNRRAPTRGQPSGHRGSAPYALDSGTLAQMLILNSVLASSHSYPVESGGCQVSEDSSRYSSPSYDSSSGSDSFSSYDSGSSGGGCD